MGFFYSQTERIFGLVICIFVCYSLVKFKPLTKGKNKMPNIVELLQNLVSTINNLQQQLADAQAAVNQVAQDSYNQGFAAGAASVTPPPSDKIYSQVELDAAVQAAVDPLNQQIMVLNGQIASMQAQIDSIPQQIADAVNAAMSDYKAQLKAAYEAQQVVESTSETGFAALLG